MISDTGVSAAQMDNGNIAIAWTRANGANTEIWTAIYSSAGSVVQAQTLRDNTGSINRNVSLVATDLGNDGNDTFRAFSTGHDTLAGSNGVDTVSYEFAGDDTLLGGIGNDNLFGDDGGRINGGNNALTSNGAGARQLIGQFTSSGLSAANFEVVA